MVSVLLILLALFPRPEASSAACSCSVPSPDSLLAWVDAVFVGVAVKEKVREHWVDHPRFGRRKYPFEREYRFRILYSWKELPVDSSSVGFKLKTLWQRLVGAEPGKEHFITVKTGGGGGDCGMGFPEGDPYLVYARRYESFWSDELWTDICSGTDELIRTRYDRLILGPPLNDYRLPEDSVGIIDPMALSEAEKNEIVGEAAISVWHRDAEARGRDASGDFRLWYRINWNVQWVPVGTVSGAVVDAGDWKAVQRQLAGFVSFVKGDTESRDWSAMADDLRKDRVEEAREILAVLDGRLPAYVRPETVVDGYDVFYGVGFCLMCHKWAIVPGSPPDLRDDIWVQSDGSYEGILGTIPEEVYAHTNTDSTYWPEPQVRPRITETQRRAVAAYVYVISHPEGLGDPEERIFDPKR